MFGTTWALLVALTIVPAPAAANVSCQAMSPGPGAITYGCAGEDGDTTAPFCWSALPSPIPPASWPRPRPEPSAVWTYRFCSDASGRVRPFEHWYVPPRRGGLSVPDFTLRTSPAGWSFVGLPAWFWVRRPGDAPIRGTSAGGLVVVGTPQRIEIDPGDGSAVLRCAWSTTPADRCAHTYTRTSARAGLTDPSGAPSFDVRARLVYRLHAERAGQAVPLDGLPTELFGAWVSRAVPVGEVQVLTTY